MKIFIISLSLFTSFCAFAGQLNFKMMKEDNLKTICNDVCGADYTTKVEQRDFLQLKVYPDLIHQAGLLCFKAVEWVSSGTPCHTRMAYLGIHGNGLAPTKTEIHRGAWAVKQGGAWCVAYNEADFKGMKKAIKAGEFKPGQVACMSGMTLDSIQ
jgi:hypothetical protein